MQTGLFIPVDSTLHKYGAHLVHNMSLVSNPNYHHSDSTLKLCLGLYSYLGLPVLWSLRFTRVPPGSLFARA